MQSNSRADASSNALQTAIERLRQIQDSAVIWRGNTAITGRELWEQYQHVVQVLEASKISRFALHAVRAHTLIPALLAAYSQGCEVLLLRTADGLTDTIREQLNVKLVFDASLSVVWEHKPRRLVQRNAEGRVLIPTSGTTGAPKLAIHSFKRLLSRIVRPQFDSGRSRPARWLLTYHPAGYAGLQVILTAIATGGELVTAEHETVAELYDAARASHPTHVSATPTFWRAFLLAAGEDAAKLQLQQITLGGEVIDSLILDQLRATFPAARIVHIYASTESGALFSVHDGRAGFPRQWLESGIDGVRLRVRDSVLEVLSPRAMLDYADGRRANLAEDDWLITGDMVSVTEDRVVFCGRVDELINVGGAKVMPEEVELALRQLPFVREVRVLGKANPVVGAIVCADIVLAPGTSPADARARITKFAMERLERHKVPRVLNFVDEISIGSNGKKLRI
jgi:acyl-coenzyme A synthetase/AMP-(fatty) acid ligase